MAFEVEELEDQNRFRNILTLSYNDLIPFIFDHLKKRSLLIMSYWFVCLVFLALAIRIRIVVAGQFPLADIFLHSLTGLIILPVLSIPIHEILHIIPYYLSGAKRIRVGMDLKQYLFYVTAHRYVASPPQFRIVAFLPFLFITISTIYLVLMLPGLWKWSLSLFLFIHTTMCAGDFALLNFYHLNRGRKIYTWDDADKKEAYFYEKTD